MRDFVCPMRSFYESQMPKTKNMASRKSQAGPLSDRAILIARRLSAQASRALERGPTRLALIGGICALALIVMGLQFSAGPDDSAAGPEVATDAVAIDDGIVEAAGTGETGIEAAASASDSQTGSAESNEPPESVAVATSPAERAWQYVQVASGDTMELIFRRLGLSPRLLHEVVQLDERTSSLVDLRPGDEIAFELDNAGLKALRTEFDDENWLFVERSEDGLASRLEARNLEVRVAAVEAEITSSLFNAGKNAGLSDNMILRLAGIFGWDIDFALDIRRGDRFALVFEEIYRDGQFLRPPINFTRVSSNFNPRRLHPVTRRVRPHNGTDYAAPTGTPVWAAGDGTVIEAGYTRANGNYIFLKHGNHIVTRYLHLSKKLTSRGNRVRQGQTIGLVGATGLATGPHLHYEFLVNGRHRDPRRVDLPEAEPLPADLLPEYKAHADTWLTRLEELLPPRLMLASSSGEGQPAPEPRPKATTAPK